MRNAKWKMESGKLPLKAVVIAVLVLLALSTAVISVDAHCWGSSLSGLS